MSRRPFPTNFIAELVGEKQPADRLPAVLVDARTFEMHLRHAAIVRE
jgi:hypothetical protein